MHTDDASRTKGMSFPRTLSKHIEKLFRKNSIFTKNNRNIKTKRYGLLFLLKNKWNFLGLEWRNKRPKNFPKKCFFHSQIARKKLKQSCLRVEQLHLKHQGCIGRNLALGSADRTAKPGENTQAAFAVEEINIYTKYLIILMDWRCREHFYLIP